jgi:hypothetical protein
MNAGLAKPIRSIWFIPSLVLMQLKCLLRRGPDLPIPSEFAAVRRE